MRTTGTVRAAAAEGDCCGAEPCCAACGSGVVAGDTKCAACGKACAPCPACAKPAPAGATTCPDCGKPCCCAACGCRCAAGDACCTCCGTDLLAAGGGSATPAPAMPGPAGSGRRDSHIAAALFSEPWAIVPAKLRAMVEVVENHRAGISLLASQAEQFSAGPRPSPRAAGAVAVIPVYGVVAQRMNLMTQFSGGVSTEKLAESIRKAAADPSVKAIVLDVDSPGGSVFGVDELAAVIAEARKSKHIVAVANSLMASAAYWLSAACDEIVVTPSGQVGAIGVITAHTDESKAEELAGVKTTYITAGKFKGEMSGPLSEEAVAALKAMAEDYYGKFVARIAKGRGVPAAKVRNGYGEGRLLTADRALAEGMVDRVATLEDVLAKLGAGPVPGRGFDSGGGAPALAADSCNGTCECLHGVAGVSGKCVCKCGACAAGVCECGCPRAATAPTQIPEAVPAPLPMDTVAVPSKPIAARQRWLDIEAMH